VKVPHASTVWRAAVEQVEAETRALEEQIEAYRKLTGYEPPAPDEQRRRNAEGEFIHECLRHAKPDGSDLVDVFRRANFDLVLNLLRRGERMSEHGLALLAGELDSLASFMAKLASVTPDVLKPKATKAEVLRAARQYRTLYKQYRQRNAEGAKLSRDRSLIYHIAATKYAGKRDAVARAREDVAQMEGVSATSIKRRHEYYRWRAKGGET